MIRALRTSCRTLRRDESGAALIETGIVLSILFLMLFGLIDFARLGFSNVLAEKATERAVRMAVVRPTLCPDVPQVNQRGLLGTAYLDLPNGTRCTDRPGLCRPAADVSCTAEAGGAASDAIWRRIQPLMPVNAGPANLRFTYSWDEALNRVGAPYAPIVTAEIVDLDFDFISPLGAFVRLAGATPDASLGRSFTFPSMSASLPAEDLR